MSNFNAKKVFEGPKVFDLETLTKIGLEGNVSLCAIAE